MERKNTFKQWSSLLVQVKTHAEDKKTKLNNARFVG